MSDAIWSFFLGVATKLASEVPLSSPKMFEWAFLSDLERRLVDGDEEDPGGEDLNPKMSDCMFEFLF
jgi:hypothetical protein